MKKLFFSLLLSLTSIFLFSQKVTVIEHPYYDVKNSGIDNISRIELSEVDTRIYVHTTFIHNWWVKFPRNTFILPEGSNQKILAIGIEKGEFDKEMYMPESNDSTFVLIFPPLDKSVREFDYGEDEETIIFGVSLDEKKKKSEKPNSIPSSVQEWLDAELDKVKNKATINYTTGDFFKKGVARIVGYMKGYDPRLGFSTGVIYASNELTRESYPQVLKIEADGRFEVEIPMHYPTSYYLSLDKAHLTLYLEPGSTLSMVMDWDEFLYADRWRNKRHDFSGIVYGGPLAPINNALREYPSDGYDWTVFQKDVKELEPAQYKEKLLGVYRDNKQKVEQGADEKQFTKKGIQMLECDAMMNPMTFLMDYVSSRRHHVAENDPNSTQDAIIPIDYFDFLQQMPLDNPILLASYQFSSFINRLEFSEPFMNAARGAFTYTPPEKEFSEYLIEDEGLELTKEEQTLTAILRDSLPRMGVLNERQNQLLEDYKEEIDAFHEKYESYLDSYREKYLEHLNEQHSRVEQYKRSWLKKDSVLTDVLNLKPNLVYDVIKTRALKFEFENASKEESEQILKIFESSVSHPFLKQEGKRLFAKIHPEVELEAYELPEGKATDIFKDIMRKYEGKYVLVDFWGIFCGPCIYGIEQSKEIREKFKDDDKIAFVFITSVADSPLDRYNKFVEEQGLEHTYRLSNDDYNYMRQLFKFNGIPHYETVNPEGKIMLKGLNYYNFEHSYAELFGEEE